ncbi:hypothetical protein ACIBEA_16465 [Streptomyces sp. NPDC051555]|uniref:hypothetical protein n=1 Tax=Streptomyces sp. NPDC051555 TaxID=3365657 RepID=UPI0037B9FA0D
MGVLIGGCGAPTARVDGARTAGDAFERALASGDGTSACGLLAPETLGQLEQDERKSCAVAIAAQGLPRAGAVRAIEVYGRQALLRLDGETLFLSQFAAGWKIVAAGCTPQRERPYKCALKGG